MGPPCGFCKNALHDSNGKQRNYENQHMHLKINFSRAYSYLNQLLDSWNLDICLSSSCSFQSCLTWVQLAVTGSLLWLFKNNASWNALQNCHLEMLLVFVNFTSPLFVELPKLHDVWKLISTEVTKCTSLSWMKHACWMESVPQNLSKPAQHQKVILSCSGSTHDSSKTKGECFKLLRHLISFPFKSSTYFYPPDN